MKEQYAISPFNFRDMNRKPRIAKAPVSHFTGGSSKTILPFSGSPALVLSRLKLPITGLDTQVHLVLTHGQQVQLGRMP